MRVFISVAMTADGYIGRDSNHLATVWTSNEDKEFFTRVTKEAGVIVWGLNTFRTVGRALPGRRTIIYARDGEFVPPAGVEVTVEPPADLIKRLESEGVTQLAVCGGTQIYTMFMQSGLVNEIFVNVHAVLFGTGLPLFNAPLYSDIELLDVHRIGNNTVTMHYKVN
jgi:dihydrofolate reductase